MIKSVLLPFHGNSDLRQSITYDTQVRKLLIIWDKIKKVADDIEHSNRKTADNLSKTYSSSWYSRNEASTNLWYISSAAEKNLRYTSREDADNLTESIIFLSSLRPPQKL